MNKSVVIVRILDKEYQVTCAPEEREALDRAAQNLDSRMREIRSTTQIIGAERIAVMAALNLSHELLETRSGHPIKQDLNSKTKERVQYLSERIEQSLRQYDTLPEDFY